MLQADAIVIRNSIPRLRSVRFKDGRAPLRVIRPALGATDYSDALELDAKEMSQHRRHNMTGYILVTWSKDGSVSAACATDGMPVPVALMPEFARSCVADWVHSQ